MRIPSSFRHTARLLAVLSVLALNSISLFSPRTGPENLVAPHGMLPHGNVMLISDGVVLGESSVVADGILITNQ